MNDPQRTAFVFYALAPSGIEVALHVELADVGSVPAMIEAMKVADKALAAANFRRSERLSPARFGGGKGGGRPETPPPPDVIVEEHCGEPMVYREAFKTNEGRDINARLECRKRGQCAEAKDGKPFVIWAEKFRKKAGAPTAPEAKANWTEFFKWCNEQSLNAQGEIVRERGRLAAARGWQENPGTWSEDMVDVLKGVLLAEPEAFRKNGVRT